MIWGYPYFWKHPYTSPISCAILCLKKRHLHPINPIHSCPACSTCRKSASCGDDLWKLTEMGRPWLIHGTNGILTHMNGLFLYGKFVGKYTIISMDCLGTCWSNVEKFNVEILKSFDIKEEQKHHDPPPQKKKHWYTPFFSHTVLFLIQKSG